MAEGQLATLRADREPELRAATSARNAAVEAESEAVAAEAWELQTSLKRGGLHAEKKVEMMLDRCLSRVIEPADALVREFMRMARRKTLFARSPNLILPFLQQYLARGTSVPRGN